MQAQTFKRSRREALLFKGDSVRFRATAVHKWTIREQSKPCVGISSERPWVDLPPHRVSTRRLCRRIGAKIAAVSRGFHGEISWRINGLVMGGGATLNRTAETRFCSWCGRGTNQCDLSLSTGIERNRASEFRRRDQASICLLIGSVGGVSADGFGLKLPRFPADSMGKYRGESTA
jgi:hypothetical protein